MEPRDWADAGNGTNRPSRNRQEMGRPGTVRIKNPYWRSRNEPRREVSER